jgi:hypothetical protein
MPQSGRCGWWTGSDPHQPWAPVQPGTQAGGRHVSHEQLWRGWAAGLGVMSQSGGPAHCRHPHAAVIAPAAHEGGSSSDVSRGLPGCGVGMHTSQHQVYHTLICCVITASTSPLFWNSCKPAKGDESASVHLHMHSEIAISTREGGSIRCVSSPCASPLTDLDDVA